MKYVHLKGLSAHLSQSAPDHLCSVYLVVSEDSYERRAAVEAIDNALPQDLARTSIDGEKASPQSLHDEIGAASLFARKRRIHITDVDQLKAPCLEALLPLIETPDVTLIISGRALRANTKLYKACEKAGVVYAYIPPKEWEQVGILAGWIKERVATLGGTIDDQAVQQLALQTQLGKGYLSCEIDKLLSFSPHITLANVETLCPSDPNGSAWDLGEFIMTGQGAQALTLIKNLIKGGGEPLGLLGQIRYQLQTGLHIASIMEKGGVPRDVTGAFPFMRGKTLDQNISNATTYGSGRLKRALLEVQKVEIQAKNSTRDGELLLEMLIAKC